MTSSKCVDFLQQLQMELPDSKDDISELASLYQRKLWHQLTLKLEDCFTKPAFNKGDLPWRIYTSFLSDFASKINLLKLAQLAVHVSKYLPDQSQKAQFLQSVIDNIKEMKQPRSDEPVLFLNMHLAQHKLECGQVQECKVLVEAGKETLEGLSDVDPSVSASVYYISSLYYKLKKDYAEFYRSSMMYLAFISSEALAYELKLPLAVDIGLAALLGEGIYNFAQLLSHPIVKVLDSSPYAWLHEMLAAFNAGDLHAYDALCSKHAAVLNQQPDLVAHERQLREKVTISCLITLISELPPESRRIPLATIAQRTKLSVDGVEFLLMKALALHLIEGTIDQVGGGQGAGGRGQGEGRGPEPPWVRGSRCGRGDAVKFRGVVWAVVMYCEVHKARMHAQLLLLLWMLCCTMHACWQAGGGWVHGELWRGCVCSQLLCPSASLPAELPSTLYRPIKHPPWRRCRQPTAPCCIAALVHDCVSACLAIDAVAVLRCSPMPAIAT
jgi:26S proteasome regulatory subunit N9